MTAARDAAIKVVEQIHACRQPIAVFRVYGAPITAPLASRMAQDQMARYPQTWIGTYRVGVRVEDICSDLEAA